MRKVREVLRLRLDCRRSHSEIAASCTISPATVSDYLRRFQCSGMTWDEASRLSDGDLESRLFRVKESRVPASRVPIDFGWVHRELRRPGVTLNLLWGEYTAAARSDGTSAVPYGYSQFCELYRLWSKRLSPTMRQTYRAGEKAFIDYSGKKPAIVDAKTGEVRHVELFVMVMGASNYTYAEASYSQRLGDFVASTMRGLEYFGAVPEVLVPDQLRSAVSGPDRYDPEINATYAEMAEHYGMAVIPARPRKPRDKAKVEAAVLLAQRWIMACLRNRRFESLERLNVAIAELLEKLNERPFQKMDGTRKSLFERIDRPAMRTLPVRRYEVAIRKSATVNIDYHVAFDDRLYSVPYGFVQAKVAIRATATIVEILHQGTRVASHIRSYGPKGTFVTMEEHRPANHKGALKWTPERLIGWGNSFGPSVAKVVELTLARNRHPETAYRSCLGIMRCAQRVGAARMDRACAKALIVSGPMGPKRTLIEALLKGGLEEILPNEAEPTSRVPRHHELLRGATYFDQQELAYEH